MIKNPKQAAVAKRKLQELELGLSAYKAQEADLHPKQFILGLNTFEDLMAEVRVDLHVYQQLTSQSVKELFDLSIKDLPAMLISARLCAGMSQKELADKLEIHEQQIQRYESDEYDKASWSRIVEILEALDFNIKIPKVTLLKKDQLITKKLVPADRDVNLLAGKVRQEGWFFNNVAS